MAYDQLLTLIYGDTPATTEGWRERLAIMRKGGSDMRYLPADDKSLDDQLAECERAGVLRRDAEGNWTPDFGRRVEAVQRQAELF